MREDSAEPYEPDAITEGLDALGNVRFRFIPASFETRCGRDGLMRVINLSFDEEDDG